MEQESRKEKYQQMRQLLNKKQWRQFLALEAKERGNILLVAREAGVSKNTIKEGRREMQRLANETGLTITVCYFPQAPASGTRSNTGSFPTFPSTDASNP